MAVMKMKLLSIIGSIDQLDAVLDTCCSSENFHLDQAMSFLKFSLRSGDELLQGQIRVCFAQ